MASVPPEIRALTPQAVSAPHFAYDRRRETAVPLTGLTGAGLGTVPLTGLAGLGLGVATVRTEKT
jgi:hypothetical protein